MAAPIAQEPSVLFGGSGRGKDAGLPAIGILPPGKSGDGALGAVSGWLGGLFGTLDPASVLGGGGIICAISWAAGLPAAAMGQEPVVIFGGSGRGRDAGLPAMGIRPPGNCGDRGAGCGWTCGLLTSGVLLPMSVLGGR